MPELFLQDIHGLPLNLFYLRTKDGIEIDFLITLNHEPLIAFEVKNSESKPVKAFTHFSKFITLKYCIQLVANIEREFDTPDGIYVRSLAKFLSTFDLCKYLPSNIKLD